MSRSPDTTRRPRGVSGPVLATIGRYQGLTRRAVLERLPDAEPQYLYDLLRLYPNRPSKMLRPVLCLASCGAFGGRIEDALPFAVALELLHTAFLIHDDIQDASRVRRGGPALHEQYGVPLALNAGDALAALASSEVVRAALRLSPGLAEAVLDEWEHMVRETTEGQALDLGWVRDNVMSVTMTDYLSMVLKKTGWYTAIQPIRIGSLIGSSGGVEPFQTFRFGYFLGLMFQIANDLEGLAADAGMDIREGKRTLMLIHLLERSSDGDRDRLARFLRSRDGRNADPVDVEWVLERMHAEGSVEFARWYLSGVARVAAREARVAFAGLPASDDKAVLVSIVDWLLETAVQRERWEPSEDGAVQASEVGHPRPEVNGHRGVRPPMTLTATRPPTPGRSPAG
jgi:geranylgeranyl diphosphate synthase, type II